MFKIVCSKESSKVISMAKYFTFIAMALIAVINVANANDHKVDDESAMMIHHAWARALPPVVPNGAAYFQVHNVGDKSDTLVSVSASIAKRSMLHESYFEDGKVAMRHVHNLVVKAGQRVAFKPGGYHIMLMGLKQPLTEGSSFELILNFKVAGAIKTIVKVTKEMKEAAGGHQHH